MATPHYDAGPDLRGWLAGTAVIAAVFIAGAVLWFSYHH